MLYFVVQIISALTTGTSLAIGSSLSFSNWKLFSVPYDIPHHFRLGLLLCFEHFLLPSTPSCSRHVLYFITTFCMWRIRFFIWVYSCFPGVHPQVRLMSFSFSFFFNVFFLKKYKFVKNLRVNIKETETVCQSFKLIEMGRKRINKVCSAQQAFEMEGKRKTMTYISFSVCPFFPAWHWNVWPWRLLPIRLLSGSWLTLEFFSGRRSTLPSECPRWSDIGALALCPMLCAFVGNKVISRGMRWLLCPVPWGDSSKMKGMSTLFPFLKVLLCLFS